MDVIIKHSKMAIIGIVNKLSVLRSIIEIIIEIMAATTIGLFIESITQNEGAPIYWDTF